MPKQPDNRKLLAVCWLIGCAWFAASGCQRRAYTDLYAESMAGEIRELEDRIYEYDAAYQGIEGELAALQSENARLHRQLAAAKSAASSGTGTSSTGRGLFKNVPGSSRSTDSNESIQLRESYPVEPEPSFQIIPNPDPVPSIVPAIPPNSSNDTNPSSVDKLPKSPDNKTKSPTTTPSTTTAPKAPSAKKDPEVPKVDLGTPSSSNVPPSSLLTPSNVPTLPTSPLNPGNTPSAPSSPPNPGNAPSPSIPTFPPASGSEDLLPPPPKISAPPTTSGRSRASKDRSVQTASNVVPVEGARDTAPQSMPADSIAIQALPAAIDEDEVNAGRIDLPGAMQATPRTPGTSSSSSSSNPRDTKIVEVAFHPTLCRGQFLGSNDSGDGFHLVLQPKNTSGEQVDIPADLTVVVLDPNRPEEQSKLGRWTLTKEELDAQLEPIGIARGFHIALKWQDAKPLGDSVQVYIRYEMEDGRRLVNERRLQIHVPSIGSASWTPRVAK